MDILTALLGIAAIVGGMVVFAWFVLGRQVEHLRGMFRVDELGWPVGVQEEDPPPTWDLGTAGARVRRATDDALAVADLPTRTAVEARVGRGTSRRGGRW